MKIKIHYKFAQPDSVLSHLLQRMVLVKVT